MHTQLTDVTCNLYSGEVFSVVRRCLKWLLLVYVAPLSQQKQLSTGFEAIMR
jgi:hypothetical protein